MSDAHASLGLRTDAHKLAEAGGANHRNSWRGLTERLLVYLSYPVNIGVVSIPRRFEV